MDTQNTCFHCGLPIPVGLSISTQVDGQSQPMCCHGCKAVAEAIVAAGLTHFYQHRTTPSRRAEDVVPAALRELAIYDRADLQKGFVRAEGAHLREAALIIEGITCAACVWLNERHVRQLPGVLSFWVNYSTHRATVRWDDRTVHLSAILAAIGAIGYVAHPFDPARQEALQQRERQMALRRLAVAGIGSMQVMMLAVGLYAGDAHGMEAWIRTLLRWTCLVLTMPVVVYAAQPMLRAAWRDLRSGQTGMDVPVSLAIIAAFVASLWYTVDGGGPVYYDSVSMFVFFLLAGRFIEMNARHRAAQISEALVRTLPATATRLDSRGAEEIIPLADLSPNDRVLIRAGALIPADGRILEGESCIDESLLTGESVPLPKRCGDVLIGGALNIDSPLVMQVEKVGDDTQLSAMVRLLERAHSEKPRFAQLADRIAGHFTAIVLVIAAIVFLAWWSQTDFDTAFRITLSVLVVTCPCALSLATPTALAAATGALTQRGVLTTRGHALETLAHITHVVFDKTGTLTFGRPQIVHTAVVDEHNPAHCLAIAAALERSAEHPIARAFMDAVDKDSAPLIATEMRNTPGRGVEGTVAGGVYRMGQPDFVAALSNSAAPFALESTNTCVVLGDKQGALARFYLSDTVRPDAADTVTALQARGLNVSLLSGDQPEAVAHIAQKIGIMHAIGALSPQDKLDQLRILQQHGAIVAMVGDGINDAPVLAAAQVSLAMGSGTQLAHATADMVLLSEKLAQLVSGIDMAHRTRMIIRENFAWAIGYNLITLPLAASGWLSPWMSALGMSCSSLLVVLNARRLRRID